MLVLACFRFGYRFAYRSYTAFSRCLTHMSDLVHSAQEEFWQPPLNPTGSVDSGACRRCGTELLPGAAFCHICGTNRHRGVPAAPTWIRYASALRILEFSNLKRWLGLPVPALCAFLLGVAFLVFALATGLVNAEFEAIQLWRIQWLVAACAAFVAGILLNGRGRDKS